MSLRARLVWLVLLATLLPALLLGWRFVRDSETEIAVAVRSLAMTADDIAADLNHRVQGTSQLHFGLAHSRLLDGGDRDACSAYLSDVREAYPQYTGILTVLPSGRLFCDSLRTGRELDLTDRNYFKRAQAGATGLILEPVFGRLTGNSVLQIVYPARTEGGDLRFLLVASLNLKTFAGQSQERAMQPKLELLLVDDKGTVMAAVGERAALPKPGTSIAASGEFELVRSQPGGGTAELPDADGQARIWAVAADPSLPATGVHVLLGVPRQALAASAQQRLRQDLLVLAVSALLLFIGVWLLAEWGVRRQVGRITTMVRALGAGDLGARIPLPYPRGELGGLMAVLNSTAASLQRQRDEIEALGLRLRQAQKLEAIGTLAGGIAHDFNNVLAAILGNLSLAHDETLAGQSTQASLEQIRRAALRARALVQRIQSFSRADTPALLRQPLRPIVEEVLALARVAMPAGVALNTDFEPLPGAVWADATQLHQVLLNLLTNAWQALQGQPGTVTVGLKPVKRGDDTLACLWVNDTGCGFDAATRERIFEPYFTTRSGNGGTGLGLSVVHGIVAAHHGSIEVESRPGAGSTFTLYLPLVAESEPDAGPPVEPPASPPASGAGRHVMVVDDDEVLSLLFERLLSRAGYRVSCHLGAHAALAAVRADPQGIDLVVTDFNMPELSGLEVCRAIAGLRPDLPTIIVSGYIPEDLPARARSAGVFEVVRKQNVEDLAPAVARALAAAARA